MVGHRIFYVSDRQTLPIMGHFWKMDAGCEITEHISQGIRGCEVLKYTEYDGSVQDAESVGVVFPVHMWGSSFAVCEFLKRLRVHRNTYVYAVAVGETLSKHAEDDMNSLRDFGRIFIQKGFGTEADIYVRFVDRKRMGLSTEECMHRDFSVSTNVRFILNGMRYHSMESIRKEQAEAHGMQRTHNDMMYATKADDERILDLYDNRENYRRVSDRKLVLNNIFLDERILQGVRLCRGI